MVQASLSYKPIKPFISHWEFIQQEVYFIFLDDKYHDNLTTSVVYSNTFLCEAKQ